MRSSKKIRKRKRVTGSLEIIAVIIVIGMMAYIMMIKTNDLKVQQHEYTAKEQILLQQIEEENERTDVLNEKKKYVKTDQYIEEVAEDKLGLTKPGVVLFQENDD